MCSILKEKVFCQDVDILSNLELKQHIFLNVGRIFFGGVCVFFNKMGTPNIQLRPRYRVVAEKS